MPVRALMIAVFCVGYAASTLAGDEFPYLAYIRSDAAVHRSGPGHEYYPTGKLTHGAAVEVYQDQGGWCAIRPPAGSFSWVRVADIKPVGGNIAAVTSDRAASRVGTSLGNQQDVEQVRLERGEEVEILEGGAGPSAEGSPGWLRMAPPAGEFRWVSLDDLSRDPLPDDRRPQRSDRRRPPAEESNDPIAPAVSAAPHKSSPVSGDAAESSIAAEITAIDLALAQVVSQEPAAWSFDAIWAETDAVLDRAETAAETGRIRAIMKRIARFEDIQRRQAALAGPVGDGDGTGNGTPPQAVPAEPVRPPTARLAADPRYDGVGTLARVASTKVGDPQFALIDQSGTVLEYVTAAPGLNLSRYVGRQVGINGLRGYLVETGDRHVTAQRVTMLESRLTR